MSKAFTKDDGSDSPGALRRAPPELRPGEKRYITPEGHARLQTDLEAMVAAYQRQRKSGADQEIADLQARISLAEATLKAVTVVVPDPQQAGRVFFGARVELEDDQGHHLAYQLVGPDELAPKEGKISAGSPIGRALLGRGVGDSISIQQPKGLRELTVIDVRYGSDPAKK